MSIEDSLVGSRADGDPYARTLLHEALAGSGVPAAQFLDGLRRPATGQPAWLQQILDGWDDHGPELPSWADSELISAGQQFFEDWDLAICAALFTASLPSAYAGAQGVGVLARASQLAKRGTANQRIAETGQMLLDITEPGAMDRGGAGYRRLVQVRMLHAAVRAVLLGEDPPGGPWPDAAGVPVNQEDLLATLLTFTVIVLRALDRMGVQVSARERTAYLHLWAVAGDLLGVAAAEQLLDARNAERLTTELQESLQAHSADGAFLMSILLDEMERAMPLGCLRVPRTLVRFLVGDKVAAMVDVPDAAWWEPGLLLAAAMNRRVSRYPVFRRISMLPARFVGRQIIQLWIDEHQRGERHRFSVRDERRRRWHISEDGAAVRVRMRARRQRIRKRGARVQGA
jgi:hypothetical protein